MFATETPVGVDVVVLEVIGLNKLVVTLVVVAVPEVPVVVFVAVDTVAVDVAVALVNVLFTEPHKIFRRIASLFEFFVLDISGFAQRLPSLIIFNKIFSERLLVIAAGGTSEYCMTPLLSRQR